MRTKFLLLSMSNRFSKLTSFSADVYNVFDDHSSVCLLNYKLPAKYKLTDKAGNWTLLDGRGIFLNYESDRHTIVEINTNKLSSSEKIEFYSNIPPFPGTLILRMLKQKVDLVPGEKDDDNQELHFISYDTHGVKIEFWVDKKTGIVSRYQDSKGTEWKLSNIKINIAIPPDEFFYFPDANMVVNDITVSFKK